VLIFIGQRGPFLDLFRKRFCLDAGVTVEKILKRGFPSALKSFQQTSEIVFICLKNDRDQLARHGQILHLHFSETSLKIIVMF